MQDKNNQKIKAPLATVPYNGYIWSLDNKGEWTWKADESKPLIKAKPVYQEKPSFKAVPVIEKMYVENFQYTLMQGIKEVSRKLSEL